MAHGQVEHLVSAGGVVYRRRNGQVEIVLCGWKDRGGRAGWGLPKGTPNPGESLEEAALRESAEETGLQVVLERPLGKIDYWFIRPTDKVRCHKTVHFYLMRAVGGDVALHDQEYDEVRWFPVDEALKMMSYKNEQQTVQKALQVLAGEEP
ncbi:Putative mutator protein MutT4 [bacterium HR23]|nr:Putative mutator protein MutT4 [bacterium HR23]